MAQPARKRLNTSGANELENMCFMALITANCNLIPVPYGLDYDLGSRTPEVVAGTHDTAIGSGIGNQQYITLFANRQQAVAAELISRFTDGPDNIDDKTGTFTQSTQVCDLMVSAI